MKVYKSNPTMSYEVTDFGSGPVSGISIRLEIATRILTGLVVPAIPGSHNSLVAHKRDLVSHALELADALIEAHNKHEENT